MSHEAYDLIDRYLRNNMEDEDYARYMKALDSLEREVEMLTRALDHVKKELGIDWLHPMFDEARYTAPSRGKSHD